MFLVLNANHENIAYKTGPRVYSCLSAFAKIKVDTIYVL